jgi:glycine/D-amino acid oxidase-like deaminating enzyme
MRTTWKKELNIPKYQKLNKAIATEVVIVGGGATGITLAYLLAKEGKKVVVLDKETLAESATAKTTAFLCENIDTILPDLVTLFGEENAQRIWKSGEYAIDKIEKIISEEKIECEFKRVKEHIYACGESGRKRLHKEYETAKSMGFAVERFPSNELDFENEGGYSILNQAKFHPLKYFTALRDKASSLGVEFYDYTEALDIQARDSALVRTHQGTVTAKFVVIATHLSIINPPTIFARKGVYISYLMEVAIPSGRIEEGIYEDTLDPYHYFRIDKGENGEDRMIIGGEDHRRELPIGDKANFKALEEYLREFFPRLPYEIRTKWSGPIVETLDGLPYIGVPDKKRSSLLVATGYSGNGMTYSMIAGSILTDHIMNRENKFAHLYSPYRALNPLAIPIKARDYGGSFIGGYLKNILS